MSSTQLTHRYDAIGCFQRESARGSHRRKIFLHCFASAQSVVLSRPIDGDLSRLPRRRRRHGGAMQRWQRRTRPGRSAPPGPRAPTTACRGAAAAPSRAQACPRGGHAPAPNRHPDLFYVSRCAPALHQQSQTSRINSVGKPARRYPAARNITWNVCDANLDRLACIDPNSVHTCKTGHSGLEASCRHSLSVAGGSSRAFLYTLVEKRL